jgi:hypothetical protein
MNTSSRSIHVLVSAFVFLSLNLLLAGGPNSEEAALNLLLRTLKHDHVYDKRISLNCVTFDTEEKTSAYFQVVLRENHTAKCGGDPDTSPVVDRYRVYRRSDKIELYDPVSDSWQSYKPTRTK